MKNVIFVTGNAHKAKYFSEMVGLDINHEKVEVPEIQSLDAEEVVIAKAKAAFKILGKPVIVEDTSLQIYAAGKLPGTFVKWFLEELGVDKLCHMADFDPERKAKASAIFAYFDGESVQMFKGSLEGNIVKKPSGSSGFGWNAVFIPKNTDKTLGEMDEETFMTYYSQIKRFDLIKEFLNSPEG